MLFNIDESLEILERTPSVLITLLNNLDEKWTSNNEGENTWSPYDVIGHLIHGEKTDWIPRMMIILGEDDNKNFVPFDRLAQFEESKGKSLAELLDEFKTRRRQNLIKLKSIVFNEQLLNREGIHPEFGKVTLKQLLATWVVHDLAHLCQISRVMAKQYGQEIGPWIKYFSIFSKA
jgi:uncharacterized damage-inducible protein DinB